jgi:hypothetical protein
MRMASLVISLNFRSSPVRTVVTCHHTTHLETSNRWGARDLTHTPHFLDWKTLESVFKTWQNLFNLSLTQLDDPLRHWRKYRNRARIQAFYLVLVSVHVQHIFNGFDCIKSSACMEIYMLFWCGRQVMLSANGETPRARKWLFSLLQLQTTLEVQIYMEVSFFTKFFDKNRLWKNCVI